MTDEGGPRLVEVAIDAAGPAGARPYTYVVPDRLGPLERGEVVLVEFGRRQALGVVLGPASEVPAADLKPVAERVRTDGPLLPPLGLDLAAWIARHYLAPPALVIRSLLPPGFLERLELVVERRPGSPREADAALAADPADAALAADPADAAILDRLASGPRPVRDLAAPDGRPALLRRVRGLAERGIVALDWVLGAAAAGPRYERRVSLTPDGRLAAAELAAGRRAPGRPLGPRQRAALGAVAAATDPGAPATELAAEHGTSVVAGLVRRGLAVVEVRERPRRPLDDRPPPTRGTRPPGSELGPEQAAAVAAIRRAIAERDPRPLLLDGVTGAGKTAVYAEAIAASLEAGRPALVLVPEIALATPLVDRLRADLGGRVAIVHSGLGAGERADEWRRIRAGQVDLVVGTRAAIGAPLADVGLIVVDEEHEAAYKSDRTPRLQARDVAIRLAELAGAAIVLGSATPAVESVGHARSGRYRSLALPQRLAGRPATVELVDLRAELAAGHRGLLSRALRGALAALDPGAGEQAILLINRRGSASVVLCRDCGHVLRCRDCDRPLVFHQAGQTLRCHHCGRAFPMPGRCPACRSARVRFLGGGTERVEREVREAFPELRVGRLDRDVTARRGAADRILDAFARASLDVLVGTSLVAKGLDVPGVVLVGVVSADVALNLPDERASERTYQLLTQAVGRAGRGTRAGRAIVQTYLPEHPAIRAVVGGDGGPFYDAELELRRRFGSPPFGQLVKLTVSLPDRTAAEAEARATADRLRDLARDRGAAVEVVGPAPAYVARRGDRWRWNVVLRGLEPAGLLDGGLDASWSVDVDPESLL